MIFFYPSYKLTQKYCEAYHPCSACRIGRGTPPQAGWWVAPFPLSFADESEKLTFLLPLFEERGTARQRGGEFLTRKHERLFTAR